MSRHDDLRRGGLPPPATRRRLPAGERRAQIVAAARAILLEQGLDQLRLEAVAERVGITKAAVLYHVSSRDQLLADVFADAAAGRHDSMYDAIDPALPLDERLRIVVRSILDISNPDPADGADRVIALLEDVRTESGLLEQARMQRDLEGATFLVGLLYRELDVPVELGSLLVATFAAGLDGFGTAVQLAGMPTDDAIELYLEFFKGAIERTRGWTRPALGDGPVGLDTFLGDGAR